MKQELKQKLESFTGANPFEFYGDCYWMLAPDLDICAVNRWILAQEGRLSTITALIDGEEVCVIYHYALQKCALNFKVRTKNNCLPSITPDTQSANWAEREIMDLYAVQFEGHPEPVPLIRPQQLSAGYYREVGGAEGKILRGEK